MNKQQFAKSLESRIHINDVPYSEITNLCYEAMAKGFKSVQIFPSAIEMCKEVLEGSEVSITALISYPQGNYTAEMKRFEVADAVSKGADCLHVCINSIALKSGDMDTTIADMRATVDAAAGKDVFFLLHVEYLTDDEIILATKTAMDCGVTGVVTSTGNYSTLNEQKQDVDIVTTEHEIELIKSVCADKLIVQAQGNIKDVELAKKLIQAGADVIGSEVAGKLYKQFM